MHSTNYMAQNGFNTQAGVQFEEFEVYVLGYRKVNVVYTLAIVGCA